jgi:predicted aspartyl protease
LTVRGPRGEREVDAIINTEYTGQLTLPPDLVSALNLPRLRQSRALLADGSEIMFDVYEAAV